MSTISLNDIKILIDNAAYPEDIFGWDLSKHQALKIYKLYRNISHEDRHPSDKELAHSVFIELGKQWNLALTRFASSIYGDKTEISDSKIYVIKSPNRIYDILDSISTANLTNVYESSEYIIKISRSDIDNELIDHEWNILNKIHKSDHQILKKCTIEPVEAFVYNGMKAIISKKESDYIPLSVLVDRYPKSLNSRHIIWIYKRLLMIIGYVHNIGYVHGCINPDNILIDIKSHSIKLIDWCYSTKINDIIKIIDGKYKEDYPKEVFDKKPINESLDIYMITKVILKMFDGKNVQIEKFLKGSLIDNPLYRETRAWILYDELSDLGKQLYGTKFIELRL